MALLDRIETRLTQSLDGLPKSDRPDIGAGYAMAGAAAVAAVVFGIVQALIFAVGVVVFFVILTGGGTSHILALGGFAVAAAVGWLLAAGLSLVVVVPSGFVGGVAVWRFVPESLRLGGFVGGLLSTLVGYVVSCAVVLPLAVAYTIIVDSSVAYVADSVVSLPLLLGYIALYTSWVTVPVGLLTGYLYERSLQ